MHQAGLPHARLPHQGDDLAMPGLHLGQSLVQHRELLLPPDKGGESPCGGGLQAAAQRTGAHQLKHRDRLRQPLHRHWPQRGDLDQPLHQTQSRRAEAAGPRGGELLHTRREDRGLPDGRIVHMQVVANGAHHHFPRIGL
jgi:hypothetical protein